MPTLEVLVWNLRIALAVTFVSAGAFVAAVLVGVGPGVLVHEVAGAVLLVELLVDLDLAWPLRRADLRPLVRVVVALGALVVAAATGASLASDHLGSGFDGAPLLPLIVLLLSVADAFRTAGAILPKGPGADLSGYGH